MNLTIHDETATGSITNQVKIKCCTESITIQELIKVRVFQEVTDYNQKRSEYYRGLVQPHEAEPVLSGYKLDRKYKINAEEQYAIALNAFFKQAFYVLIDEQKIDDPGFVIKLKPHTKISFLKLQPLVGG